MALTISNDCRWSSSAPARSGWPPPLTWSTGATPLVLEAGERSAPTCGRGPTCGCSRPGSSTWTEWRRGCSRRSGWTKPPASEYPTGGELVRHYLEPLAALPELRPHVRLGARVAGVSRLGLDRLKTAGRESTPFVVHVVNAGRRGAASRACGHRRLGDGAARRTRSERRPSRDGRARARRTACPTACPMYSVNSAHATRAGGRWSWAADTRPSPSPGPRRPRRTCAGHTRVLGIRRQGLGQSLRRRGGRRPARARPARQRLRPSSSSGRIVLFQGSRSSASRAPRKGIVATAAGRRCRPWTRSWPPRASVRISGCCASYAWRSIRSSSAQRRWRPVIDPNVHSCGTVPPHGEDVLRQPEPGFYLAGMKSYGRAPNFLCSRATSRCAPSPAR